MRDRLPTFVVLGAQKCGTTTLGAWLAAQPDVSFAEPKELNFFTFHHARGAAWYASHFAALPARGEASPEYTAWPWFPGAPGRMRELLPDARLVYLVRDPVARVASHWSHGVASGLVEDPLEAVVTAPGFRHSELALRTRYWLQLERYLSRYPEDAVLLLDAAELRTDRAGVLRRVRAHLGLDPEAGVLAGPAIERDHNVSAERTRPPAVARRLGRSRLGWTAPGLRARRALTARYPAPLPAPEITPRVVEAVAAVVAGDVARLRAWSGRTLADWRGV